MSVLSTINIPPTTSTIMNVEAIRYPPKAKANPVQATSFESFPGPHREYIRIDVAAKSQSVLLDIIAGLSVETRTIFGRIANGEQSQQRHIDSYTAGI